jgi:glycosyltransferase involved in cell wall biosynthesis
MRLAFLGDGSLSHVRRWVGYFREEGHDVLLLSFENVDGCPFPARRLKRRLPTRLLGYLASLGRVRRELRAFEPDLVNALYAGGYGLVASLGGVRPLVVSCLGSDLLVDYPSSPVHRIQIGYALRRADLVTTDAEELSRRAAAVGAPHGKILTAYFGVDERIFHPAEEPPAAPASAETGPRVVSTRNLYPLYHLDLLVEAAPIIRAAVEARFIICGDGPERTALEARAAALGLGGDFVFTGKLDPRDIADELRRASVYVSTSRSDSTSVSLLEAMACGAPPVVTDLESNREWLKDGENGLLVPLDDPAALAAAVLRFIEDSRFAASAREQNLGIVRERGIWRENMKRVSDAFRNLVARSRPL